MMDMISRQCRMEVINYRTEPRQKKSGHPLEPGNRSNAHKHARHYKNKDIIHKVWQNVKDYRCEYIALLWVLAVLVFIAYANNDEGPIFPASPSVEPMTTAEAIAEKPQKKRYYLTNDEREEIASVITAEAIGEPYAGKVAVAQCILQACEDEGIRPYEVLTEYGYSKNRPVPCSEALKAVGAVFDCGQVATAEPIKYFYAPACTNSQWHETQDYVMTINGHRFFAEKGE